MVIVEKNTKKIRIMSKIEFNPRKKHHINYLEFRIHELHVEIHNLAMLIVISKKVNAKERKKLETKLHCIKKYSRRLKLIKL